MKDELFEKYWQKQFEHFETEPNEQVWDKMSHELFVRQCKLMFKDFFVNPSTRVWNKIALVLWWNRFTRFSPYTFNIYYFLIAILSAFSLSYLLNINNHDYKQKITKNTTLNQQFNNPRSASIWLENKTLSNSNEKAITSNKQNFTNIIRDQQNNHSQEVSLYDNKEKQYTDNALEVNLMQSIYNLRINQHAIAEMFTTSNNAVLKWFDHHSLSLYYAPTYFNPALTLNSVSGEYVKSNYKPTGFEMFNDFTFSVFYERQHFNFKFHAGISYQSFSQSYSYKKTTLFTDTVFNQHIIDNSHYNYSFIQVLNLDSLLLTGDTVWITYVDSTLVTVFDTLQTTEIQTIRKNTNEKQRYSISAIEIPFMVGYSYSFGKFDLTLKAGSSITYVLFTKGYLPLSLINEYNLEPFKQDKIYNFYINAVAGVEANYFITDKLSLSFMPLYRNNLTRIIKNDLPLKLNLRSWSFNFGIKYQLR